MGQILSEELENSLNELNFQVDPQSLYLANGQEIPARKALVRLDNSAVLGIVTDKYVPFQNQDFIHLLHRIASETGMTVSAAGVAEGGKKVFGQLFHRNNELSFKKIGMQKDYMKTYVSVFNSFDGSTALSFGHSNITMSCSNKFNLGYRSVSGDRHRHADTIWQNVEDSLVAVSKVQKEEVSFLETIKEMSQIDMQQKHIDIVFRQMFGLAEDTALLNTGKLNQSLLESQQVSTRKINSMNTFMDSILHQTSTKGKNVWGLFSGVTHYTTHTVVNSSTKKMFGELGSKERNTFLELSSF